MENAITSYRSLDLENDISGGSNIEGFPIYTIPVLTKHDRQLWRRAMKLRKISVDALYQVEIHPNLNGVITKLTYRGFCVLLTVSTGPQYHK